MRRHKRVARQRKRGIFGRMYTLRRRRNLTPYTYRIKLDAMALDSEYIALHAMIRQQFCTIKKYSSQGHYRAETNYTEIVFDTARVSVVSMPHAKLIHIRVTGMCMLTVPALQRERLLRIWSTRYAGKINRIVTAWLVKRNVAYTSNIGKWGH